MDALRKLVVNLSAVIEFLLDLAASQDQKSKWAANLLSAPSPVTLLTCSRHLAQGVFGRATFLI